MTTLAQQIDSLTYFDDIRKTRKILKQIAQNSSSSTNNPLTPKNNSIVFSGVNNTEIEVNPTLLAQLGASLQVMANLTVGINIISHNLNLAPPFATKVTIVDSSNGSSILAPISNNTTNSFTITSPIVYNNLTITILT